MRSSGVATYASLGSAPAPLKPAALLTSVKGFALGFAALRVTPPAGGRKSASTPGRR